MVLAQNRHIDQWNRMENPEMDQQLHHQLIFNKTGKNIPWEKKRQSLQKMVLGKLDGDMQKDETGPFFCTIHKNKFKCMKELNVREETIKIPEGNTGRDFCDLRLSSF